MCAVLAVQVVFIYLGGSVLRTAPLNVDELLFTLLWALSVFPADMIRKVIFKKLFKRKNKNLF